MPLRSQITSPRLLFSLFIPRRYYSRVLLYKCRGAPLEEREQGVRQQEAALSFFFSFFDLDPRPLTSLFSLSFPPPISPTKQNKTASESGKPMKMHHDKLAKKGADEAGEGTRR